MGRPKGLKNKPKEATVEKVMYELVPITGLVFTGTFWRVSPGAEQDFIQLMTAAGKTAVRFGGYQ